MRVLFDRENPFEKGNAHRRFPDIVPRRSHSGTMHATAAACITYWKPRLKSPCICADMRVKGGRHHVPFIKT